MGLIARFLAKRADRAITDWMCAEIRPAPGASIVAATAYGAYHDWCRENRRRIDMERLWTALRRFPRERRGERLYYLDIELREAA